jgi:hypothetical protein
LERVELYLFPNFPEGTYGDEDAQFAASCIISEKLFGPIKQTGALVKLDEGLLILAGELSADSSREDLYFKSGGFEVTLKLDDVANFVKEDLRPSFTEEILNKFRTVLNTTRPTEKESD